MRCLFTIILIVFGCNISLKGQNIILGETTPDLRIKQWLMDMQPDNTDYTCILFYHSESPQCRKYISRVKKLTQEADRKISVIILTKEKHNEAGVTLTEHLDDLTTVAFDDGGRTFRAYGVKFIPFCVVCNSKRKAVWCGHAGALTETIIENITAKKER